jgi:predicted DNA-binding WGR domain protein
MPSFSSPRLVDGAPFGADVVVIAGKQWFAVNESSAEEPRSLPAEPSWWAWTVDAARRLLWVAATEQGDLFGTLHPEGTRPVAGHVWGRFIRSAARSPESLVVAEFHRPAVVLGPDGQQSERVLPEAELIAALPDGALLAFSRQKITLVSRTGESSPVPRPDDWMDEAHTALVAEDGAVHVLGISEGATREAIHQRFDGTSWSAVAEGPRAALAGRLVGADAGQGRLVAVQSRMEKPLGAETLWFDGAWRSEPLRLGPGWRLPPGHNPWEPFVKAVGRDPATGHLLLVAVGAHGPVLAVYAAEGFWKVVASLAMQTPGATAARGLSAEALSEVLDCAEFGLRAADRSVVMVGATGDCSGASWRLEGSFGALLDALPAPGKIPVPELNVPPPAFHALVKREEGSQKFWTATVEGATCTIAWGKRGAKGQSKSSLAKTAARAQADAAKKAEEKLAEGYEVVPEGPEVARSGARQSFPFTRGETEPTAGNALGNPEIAGGPTCSTCDRPMSLVIQLARHPERLPLRKHAGLAIWVCVTTSCRPWQRDGGANAAQLLGEDAAVPSGARAIAFETSVMEQEGGAEDEPPPARSHLGGFPVWIQDEDRPLCDVCSDPMAFALQIDGHDAEHNFGDDGSGYAFVCPRECSAKFLSQSC